MRRTAEAFGGTGDRAPWHAVSKVLAGAALVALAACAKAPAVDSASAPEPTPAPQLQAAEPEILPPDGLTLLPKEAEQAVELPRPVLSATTCAIFDPVAGRTVSDVMTVTVCAEVLGASAGAKLAVEFFTPQDMPFQRHEAPVTGTAFTRQRFEFSLPVSGTMIDSSHMGGQWKAKFFLDGAALAVQTFDLSP